jgi:hypothetical protein
MKFNFAILNVPNDITFTVTENNLEHEKHNFHFLNTFYFKTFFLKNVYSLTLINIKKILISKKELIL